MKGINMIRIESNKTLLTDKELADIKKSSYDQGVIDGVKLGTGAVLKNINALNPEDIEGFNKKKKEIIDFCLNVIAVEGKGAKQKIGKNGNN